MSDSKKLKRTWSFSKPLRKQPGLVRQGLRLLIIVLLLHSRRSCILASTCSSTIWSKPRSRAVSTSSLLLRCQTERWKPEDLNASLWREWVKTQARTHIDMSPQKRLAAAVSMCNHLIQQLPIKELKLDVGGGGNWDDDAIEKQLRMGCQLVITNDTRESAKRHVRDELGALKLVKKRRNSLAHGSISFVDCADGVDVGELVTTTEAVGAYLREVIASFISYIDLFDFLRSESRPGLSA